MRVRDPHLLICVSSYLRIFMDLWLCHEERDQRCYFGVLSMVMDDLVYRGITRKAVNHDSNDMRMKIKDSLIWILTYLYSRIRQLCHVDID
jgi:hypothetical protein